mgnify:FL=1
MADVNLFRLITGEFVVSEFKSVSADIVEFSNPAQVIMQQDTAGQMKVGLVDFLPFSDLKVIQIATDNIIYAHVPKADMFNAYTSMFGSGIVLAGPNDLPTARTNSPLRLI